MYKRQELAEAYATSRDPDWINAVRQCYPGGAGALYHYGELQSGVDGHDSSTCLLYTSVLESMRGMGIGKALLLRSLLSLRERGYAYAIIGWAGPTAFYEKAVDAIPIPGEEGESYGDMVQQLSLIHI